jgi:hypothetical protein
MSHSQISSRCSAVHAFGSLCSDLQCVHKKSRNTLGHFGFSGKTGGNLLPRKLYNHYHPVAAEVTGLSSHCGFRAPRKLSPRTRPSLHACACVMECPDVSGCSAAFKQQNRFAATTTASEFRITTRPVEPKPWRRLKLREGGSRGPRLRRSPVGTLLMSRPLFRGQVNLHEHLLREHTNCPQPRFH